MNTHADKTQENKNQSVAKDISQRQVISESFFHFEDNRPEAIAQRKLKEMTNNSPNTEQAVQLQSMADYYSTREHQPVQKKENNTLLPDNLKFGIESLSGYSMDDVKVHRNSDKPAQLNAHAYAQGKDIHLAIGQEKYLPHEAWHVVQQKQGRVKPTLQLKGKININDNTGLEKEADMMGKKAMQLSKLNTYESHQKKEFSSKSASENIYQLQVDPEFHTWLNNREASRSLIDDFYFDNVRDEIIRAKEYCTNEYLVNMVNESDKTFNKRVGALMNYNYPKNISMAVEALNLLVDYTNQALDEIDVNLTESMSVPYSNQNINHADPIKQGQNQRRLARRLREHTKVKLGESHENEVRGFKSVAEGNAVLNNILGILVANGINDGQVAIRGSAVRGMNRDKTRQYRQGTEDADMANDSSDLDFFFTSPTLEHAINCYADGNHYEGGGNVHPDTLNDLLSNSRLNLNGVNQPALATAINLFSNNTKTLIGRKADVTLIKVTEIASFSDDEYILV